MDFYKISWKNSAKKELKNLDKNVISRLIEAVEALATNPYPTDCIKLIGVQSTYRIRVGDYRIIYQVQSQVLVVEIIRVGHRKNVYK